MRRFIIIIIIISPLLDIGLSNFLPSRSFLGTRTKLLPAVLRKSLIHLV
jgi:hypothetical protein